MKKTKYPYQGSEVPVENSQIEIDKLLKRYGVQGSNWKSIWTTGEVELQFPIEFDLEGVKKGFIVTLKPPKFYALHKSYDPKTGHYSMVNAPDYRAGMRCLFYYLKSMLEAEKYGLARMDELFMSKILVVLPEGVTGTLGDLFKQRILEGSIVPALEARKGP